MIWRTNRLFLSFCIKYRANDAFLACRSHFQVTGKLPAIDSCRKFRVSILFSWNEGTTMISGTFHCQANVKRSCTLLSCQLPFCWGVPLFFYGISLFNNWQSKWIVEKSLFPSSSYISSWNIRTNALAPISWCIALKRLVLEWVAT